MKPRLAPLDPDDIPIVLSNGLVTYMTNPKPGWRDSALGSHFRYYDPRYHSHPIRFEEHYRRVQLAAYHRVNAALRDGRLVRPEGCDRCVEPSGRIEAHHDDYERPLDVLWLCVRCHRAHHVAMRRAGIEVRPVAPSLPTPSSPAEAA